MEYTFASSVIISSYAKDNDMTETNFEGKFKAYIKDLINDHNHVRAEYNTIHKCAYMLWVAAIKGNDFALPRAIAKRIIVKYGRVGFSNESMDFLGGEIVDLNNQLDQWMNSWTFNNSKTFAVKVLLLNLLLSQRKTVQNGYKADSVTLDVHSALAYKLDAGKLQLDHLEANVINNGIPQCYYLPEDPEKRQNDVNGYLGNFMILDATNNNQKNNVPMSNAMQYYEKINSSWLITDISDMMKDAYYFDIEMKIPKEEFFIERTKRLKKYIKALLGRQLSENQITIQF